MNIPSIVLHHGVTFDFATFDLGSQGLLDARLGKESKSGNLGK